MIIISKTDNVFRYYHYTALLNKKQAKSEYFMFKTKNLVYMNFLCYYDIEIPAGCVTFIRGASGCGKSTLLKMLNKTQAYSDGEIFYKGKTLSSYDGAALRREVKLISQTTFLFPGTIRDNFSLFYRYCDYDKALTDERISRFLSIVEIDFDLDDNCDFMSGGERQRIYIAVCLSMESEVIMLDEPTSALDSSTSIRVLSNIIAYANENDKTLIVISHDNDLIERFSENTIGLSGGHSNEQRG